MPRVEWVESRPVQCHVFSEQGKLIRICDRLGWPSCKKSGNRFELRFPSDHLNKCFGDRNYKTINYQKVSSNGTALTTSQKDCNSLRFEEKDIGITTPTAGRLAACLSITVFNENLALQALNANVNVAQPSASLGGVGGRKRKLHTDDVPSTSVVASSFKEETILFKDKDKDEKSKNVSATITPSASARRIASCRPAVFSDGETVLIGTTPEGNLSSPRKEKEEEKEKTSQEQEPPAKKLKTADGAAADRAGATTAITVAAAAAASAITVPPAMAPSLVAPPVGAAVGAESADADSDRACNARPKQPISTQQKQLSDLEKQLNEIRQKNTMRQAAIAAQTRLNDEREAAFIKEKKRLEQEILAAEQQFQKDDEAIRLQHERAEYLDKMGAPKDDVSAS